MEAPSKDSHHVLFTVYPEDEERLAYILKVATPYLSSLIMEEIAVFDAIDQVSFNDMRKVEPQGEHPSSVQRNMGIHL